MVAFEILADVKPILVRLKKVPSYVIFEVEHHFTRKTRFVADRYWECTVSRQSNVTVGPGLFSASNQGKITVSIWTIYGLKSRRSHLCNAIIDVIRQKNV